MILSRTYQYARNCVNPSRYLWAALLLCLTHSSVAIGTTQGFEPVDDQILLTDELFSLVIRPTDPDPERQRLVADVLPPESVLLENLDGSRTFLWTPDQSDIGDHLLVFRLLDKQRPDNSVEQFVKLTIAPAQEYLALQKEFDSGVSTINNPPINLVPEPVTSDVEQANGGLQNNGNADWNGDWDEGWIADPEADREIVADLTTAAAETLSAINEPAEIVPAAIQQSSISDQAGDQAKVQPSVPSVIVAQSLALQKNSHFEYTFKLIAAAQDHYEIRVLNRPDGMILTDNKDSSYTLVWLPSKPNMGTTTIIVQLFDTDADQIISSDKVHLHVK